MRHKPNKQTQLFGLICVSLVLCLSRALALHSGLMDWNGGSVFTQGFVQDYDAAQKSVNEQKSAAPLLALLSKYPMPAEQAELELSIGLIYNQRTGVVDNPKAVEHLSRALTYRLPERTCLSIWMWRGNSYEASSKYSEALQDYLRAMLACSYHDLEGGWPEILSGTVTFSINSDDTDNDQRRADYARYREAIDLKRFLLMHRYYLIEAIKRLQVGGKTNEKEIAKVLQELTPDATRYKLIVDLINSKNERPWP